MNDCSKERPYSLGLQLDEAKSEIQHLTQMLSALCATWESEGYNGVPYSIPGLSGWWASHTMNQGETQ